MLRLIVLAIAAFLIILIAEFPAGWCRWALPADISCHQIEGTVWSGGCDGLRVQQLPLGDLSWHLHPLGLLRARVDADVGMLQGSTSLRGTLTAGWGGRIDARDIEVQNLNLAHLPLRQLPRGLQGVAQAQISQLRWDGSRIEALAGTLRVQGLVTQGTRLGDYQLQFPADNPESLIGVLRDTGGPLHVEGTVHVLPAPGFELNGRVLARDTAAADLADQIRYLASPDNDGMRPFSFAATF